MERDIVKKQIAATTQRIKAEIEQKNKELELLEKVDNFSSKKKEK